MSAELSGGPVRRLELSLQLGDARMQRRRRVLQFDNLEVERKAILFETREQSAARIGCNDLSDGIAPRSVRGKEHAEAENGRHELPAERLAGARGFAGSIGL